MGLTDNPRYVPVVKTLLGKKDKGKDREGDILHCRSAIGLLHILAGCAGPDKSMAVHQVSKFSTNPKSFHNALVKRIGISLLGTRDEVLKHVPNEDKGLEAFVYADFAGGCNTTTTIDPKSA